MQDRFLVMCTKKGTIKKTNAMAFAKIRSTGIRALGLNDGDELVFCGLSSGDDTIVIASRNGQGIRFSETEVRSMGRQAAGVRGIRLKGDDEVVGFVVVNDDCNLLFATSRGYGKRVRVSDFRIAHRGGVGVRTIPTTTRNGNVIGLVLVEDNSQILLIDENGKIMRLSPQEVRTMGRQAKGGRLIRLDKTQVLSSVVSFTEDEDDVDTADDNTPSGGSSDNQVSDEQPEIASTESPAGEDVVQAGPAEYSVQGFEVDSADQMHEDAAIGEPDTDQETLRADADLDDEQQQTFFNVI